MSSSIAIGAQGYTPRAGYNIIQEYISIQGLEGAQGSQGYQLSQRNEPHVRVRGINWLMPKTEYDKLLNEEKYMLKIKQKERNENITLSLKSVKQVIPDELIQVIVDYIDYEMVGDLTIRERIDELYNTDKEYLISNFDTSNVTTFSNLFLLYYDKFNQPLNNWNTSNVKKMCYMFSDCKCFNQPLNNWNTSNVKDMRHMFSVCHKFNQPLDKWDTKNVKDMSYMFYDCFRFNQCLSNWNTSNVINMGGMFENCTLFNQNIENWNTSKVVNMYELFRECYKYNQPLNNWDVRNVENFGSMFIKCIDFNQQLDKWKLNNVRSTKYMFKKCLNFNQDLSSWRLPNSGVDTCDMFIDCDIEEHYKCKNIN